MHPPSLPLDVIRQPAFLYDAGGRIVAANDLAEALAGRPLAGRTLAAAVGIFDARTPDGTPLMAAEMPASRALSGEEAIDVPFVVRAADGRPVHILASASPIREEGEIGGALVIWQDVSVLEVAIAEQARLRLESQTRGEELVITEEELRLQNEELMAIEEELRQSNTALQTAHDRLRESEEQYRSLAENVPSVLMRYDATMRVVYLSPQAERSTGMPASEFIGRTNREVGMPGDLCTLWETAIAEVFRTGEPRNLEFDFPSPDGTQTFYLKFAPEFDSQGHVRYVLGISTEITERKRAEAEVRQSQAMLAAALGSMTDAVFISDEHGRFLAFNDAFVAYHRFRDRDECSRTFATCSTLFDVWFTETGEPAPPEMWAVSRALRGETAIDVEYTLRRRDTGETWIGRYTFAPIRNHDGLIVGSVVTARDITDRKRTEAALRESEERAAALLGDVQQERDRLSSLIDSISDEIWFADTDRRFTLANPRAVQEFALSPGNGVGVENLAASLEVFRPDGSPRPMEETPTLRALNGEVIRYKEEIIRTPATGELRYRQVSAAPVRDGAGTIIGSVSVVRDVTDQKRAEEAIRTYATAIDTSQDGIFTTGPDMRIRTWNQGAERLFGYTADEVIGSTTDFLEAQYPDQSREEVIHQLSEQGAWSGETTSRRKDGSYITTLASASLVRDAAGTPIGFTAVHHDITERVAAEQAVRIHRNLLETVIENAPIAVNLTRGSDLRIVLVNAAYQAIAPGKEMIGKTLVELWPETGQAFGELSRRVLATGEAHHVVDGLSTIQRMPDGPLEEAYFTWWLIPVELPDGMPGILNIAEETTERKLAEEALRTNAENLKRSNEDLERYAYVSSHDLQEPLRAIVSFSQLLERRYKGQLDADADDYIDFIVEGGLRMQVLIQDLLAYSRVNTTKQALTPTVTEDVLAAVERNLALQLSEAGGTITYDPVPVVLADPMQLEQVFANLVSNAIKFRKADVPLRVRVGARRLDGFWEFSVADNGIGIEKEYFEKIFVIFQRLHTKDAYPGTGIGLAIVKRIIDRHGGTCRVESTPGEGSTFYFTLPAA